MKTLHVIFIAVAVLVVVAASFILFGIKPIKNELAETNKNFALCDSVATAKNAQINSMAGEIVEANEYGEARLAERDAAWAELDTIRPVALIADSLALANAELQAQVATLAAASKVKTSGKKTAATTATTVKTLKGVKGQLTFSPDSSMVIILRSDSAKYISQVPKNFQGKVLIGTR
jgi:hypothetical protein